MKTAKALIAMAVFVGFFAMSNNVYAGKRVYVKIAPPAPKKVVVVKPAKPWKHAAWVSGHWKWEKGHWVWAKGHWRKTKAGQRWIDGHWKHAPHGWVWIEGHWAK